MEVKGPIVDANNRLNRIFHLFNSLISEFSLGNRLIDTLPSCFSFHLSDRKNKESKKMYIYKLNKLILQILVESKMAVVISDANIKNQVAMSIVLRLKVLRSISPGDSMDMDKGYDDIISCATCSLSQCFMQ